MKVKELIGKYENILKKSVPFTVVNIHGVLRDLKQLDEPEKVKVSEEEAKFLETFNLNHRSDVTKALYYISRVGFGYRLTNNNGIELKGLSEGFRNIENRKRLIEAILYGYEVEKEPKYIVKLKSNDGRFDHLVQTETSGFHFYNILYMNNREHTRKELEQAGFGWVFDCEGIEIEEVEE